MGWYSTRTRITRENDKACGLGMQVERIDKGEKGPRQLLYRQLKPGLEVVLDPLVDDPDRLRLDDPRLLEGPEQLAHGLGPIFDDEHDELALLFCHNLGLLHEGGCAATGGRGGGGGGWRRLRLYVEVELGLQLSELVFHHAFVVAAVVRTRLLEYNPHTTIDDRPPISLFHVLLLLLV